MGAKPPLAPRAWQLLNALDATRNFFPVTGPRGYRKTKPPCLNGSYRSKGPKARRVPITLAPRA